MTALTPLSPEQPTVRLPSGGEYLLIWICVALVAGIGGFAGWQFWHTGRIFSGVRVAGVPVGGETRATALLRLHKELTPYPVAPVFIEYEGRRWALGAESLTAEADLEDAVNRAYFVGREGGLLDRALSQWHAFNGQQTIWPEVAISEGMVRQIVGAARGRGAAAKSPCR